jgi:hypothetical protein
VLENLSCCLPTRISLKVGISGVAIFNLVLGLCESLQGYLFGGLDGGWRAGNLLLCESLMLE